MAVNSFCLKGAGIGNGINYFPKRKASFPTPWNGADLFQFYTLYYTVMSEGIDIV